MAEYTYEDIIIDPNDPRLEGAIGKECYFSDYPKKLLNSAIYNLPEYLDCLTDIRKEGVCTFVDKKGTKWASIIIKKEEPKKYVPFKNAREFINVYSCVEATLLKKEDYFLSSHGIWLKRKDKPPILMVTEIYSFGVVISGNMDTTKEPNDEYVTITETTLWRELLMLYTFLDGTPCGKESKE